jgi:hypothetical protein
LVSRDHEKSAKKINNCSDSTSCKTFTAFDNYSNFNILRFMTLLHGSPENAWYPFG